VVGGFEPQSWALAGAGFTQFGSMPTPQVPPADIQALPDVDDVHAIRIVPRASEAQLQCNMGRAGVMRGTQRANG
jgi:hypothetical protein